MNAIMVIVNYNCNELAVETRNAFLPFMEVVLIDSGSDLGRYEKCFDVRLPNVYYSGLYNEALRVASDKDVLYFVCSDVRFRNHENAVKRMFEAFEDESIGAYAPSCDGRCIPCCKQIGEGGLRDVAYAEGYCFASRPSLLKGVPVDMDVNFMGYGLDLYLGYLCYKKELRYVVDDSTVVFHAHEVGYSKEEANEQMSNWVKDVGGDFDKFVELCRVARNRNASDGGLNLLRRKGVC